MVNRNGCQLPTQYSFTCTSPQTKSCSAGLCNDSSLCVLPRVCLMDIDVSWLIFETCHVFLPHRARSPRSRFGVSKRAGQIWPVIDDFYVFLLSINSDKVQRAVLRELGQSTTRRAHSIFVCALQAEIAACPIKGHIYTRKTNSIGHGTALQIQHISFGWTLTLTDQSIVLIF